MNSLKKNQLEIITTLLKEANQDPRFRQTMKEMSKRRNRKKFIKTLKAL